ncbi:DUF4352 domain-containing protein [Candidatus Saccharibacteria bacterium]|nr:DUF4352 domain-containing protein [Candidatus Saccharibacteria bacterium]
MAKKKHETPLESIEGAIEDEVKELKKEYKRFERFKDENSLLFGVFVLAMVALVIINTMFWVQYTSNKYEQQSRQTATIANLTSTTSLQTAHNFAVSAKVRSVGTNAETDPAFPLEPGKTRLTMEIKVTNTTAVEQQFIPVSQLYVRDSDGGFATLYPSSSATRPIEPADLKPGQSVSGQVSFAISNRTDTPLLYIDTMWDKSTPLVIDVLH